MTIAILKYEVAQGKTKSLKVRPRQSVVIGASNSADIKLQHTLGVAAQHCEVKFDGQSCIVEHLGNGKRSVRVNGNKVKSQILHDGDCIEIGENRMTVILQSSSGAAAGSGRAAVAPLAVATAVGASAAKGEEASDGVDSAVTADAKQEPEAADQPEEVRVEPVFATHANGVRSIEVSDYATELGVLIDERDANWRYVAMINHLASKLDGAPPVDDPATENLLGAIEDPLSQENDLYLLQPLDKGAVLNQFTNYAQKNSGILGWVRAAEPEPDPAPSKGQPNEAVEGPAATEPEDECCVDPGQLKFLATWFLTASGLKFHLLHGSELLAKKIFAMFDALVFFDIGTSKYLVVFNDPTINDWESFVESIKAGDATAGQTRELHS